MAFGKDKERKTPAVDIIGRFKKNQTDENSSEEYIGINGRTVLYGKPIEPINVEPVVDRAVPAYSNTQFPSENVNITIDLANEGNATKPSEIIEGIEERKAEHKQDDKPQTREKRKKQSVDGEMSLFDLVVESDEEKARKKKEENDVVIRMRD